MRWYRDSVCKARRVRRPFGRRRTVFKWNKRRERFWRWRRLHFLALKYWVVGVACRVAGPRSLGSEHRPPATVHWHQNCCSPCFTSCSPAPRATLLLQPRNSPTYVIHVCAGLHSLNWALSSFPRVTQHDLSTLRPSHHRPRMAQRFESS